VLQRRMAMTMVDFSATCSIFALWLISSRKQLNLPFHTCSDTTPRISWRQVH